MSLAGRRIVVTRATHQADEVIAQIKAHGGIPILYPCIAITAPDDTSALNHALKQLGTFDWLIFTSSNTVYALQQQLQRLDIKIDGSRIKIATVGTKTDKTLRDIFGQSADFIPTQYTADELARDLPLSLGDRIFLPQSALADDTLSAQLSARGATVTVVDAYQTIIGSGGDDVPALLEQHRIDAVTFTSGSTVTNFVERIMPLTAFDVPAICIGASTYDVAIEAGFKTVLYPDNFTINNMIDLLSDFLEEATYGKP
ncbi:MAG: uroporphyrinogen-III synthase [Phototrophicaceae bacterium]